MGLFTDIYGIEENTGIPSDENMSAVPSDANVKGNEKGEKSKPKKTPEELFDDEGMDESVNESTEVTDIIAWFPKVEELAIAAGWSVLEKDESDEPFILLGSDEQEEAVIIAEAYEGAIDVYVVSAESDEILDEGVSVETIDEAEVALGELMSEYLSDAEGKDESDEA